MAHLNTAVYLRALKQGLQLLPYIKSHRIFRQCQFNRQFDIARAQYSDTSDPESSKGSLEGNTISNDSYNNKTRNPFKENGRNNRKAFERHDENRKDQLEERSNYQVDSNDKGHFDQNNAHMKRQFERSYEHKEGRHDRNFEHKGRFDVNYIEGKQGGFDKGRSYETREGNFDRKYGSREDKFDRNDEHGGGRFDRKYGIREDKFDRNFEHKGGRFDRTYGGREDKFDRSYEHRDSRYDNKYGGREGKFDRNYEGREDKFDRSYKHRQGRYDNKYGGREGRFDKNYEHREDRFDRNHDHREGRFDRNHGHREGRFDRNHDHREGRFDRNHDHREGRFDGNHDHREGRFDRNHEGREGRFDRNHDYREGRFDRNHGHREGRFDRNHEGRRKQFDGNYSQSWMEGNGSNQKDDYLRRRQGYNIKDTSNSKVNQIFSHTDVQMKFTDEELSGRSFNKEKKFVERGRRPAFNRYDNRDMEPSNKRDQHLRDMEPSYKRDKHFRDMEPSYKRDKHFRDMEPSYKRDQHLGNMEPSYRREKHLKESKPIKESVAVLESDEDYESNEDFQEQDFDVSSYPDKIAPSRRIRNYRREGAYKHVRYDQPRSSTEHEEDGLTSDLESDIDNTNENETFAEEKSISRSQSFPQLSSVSDDFGSHSNKDVSDTGKWKKSYGSLSDKKFDRRSDEENDEEFVKPHRRLKVYGRKNVPVWYALQMKKLAKEGQIKEAVDVLEKWMLERDRVQPDHYTFSVLINILAKAGLTDKAFKIFNKMKKMGFYSNAHVYSALFNACANSPWKSDGLARAVKLRITMKEKDWIPNYKTSTAMIKAFGKCGDLQTCFEIMDDICVRYPTEIDSSCFSTLLSVCITDQQNGFKLALGVWQKMQDMDIRPTGDVYNFMLKAVRDSHFDFKLPKEDKSDTFFEDSESPALLQSSGENSLVPSENLPNLLIEKHTDIDELLSTIDFTKQANKLSLFGGADSILQHMSRNQVQTDIRIFSLLLDCSEHTLEAEDKLLEIMKEQNVRPDPEYCNSLIRRRALRCDNDNARAVLQLITEHHLQPNMETFTNLALTCYQMKDGVRLLKDIEELDSEPTLAVISNLVRSSGLNFHYKNQLLIKMEELDIKPDKALIINIEKHIKKGKQVLVKLENESLNGEKDSNLEGLQTGFEHFMKHYKGWLHRTYLEEPEHPYHIFRKNESEN